MGRKEPHPAALAGAEQLESSSAEKSRLPVGEKHGFTGVSSVKGCEDDQKGPEHLSYEERIDRAGTGYPGWRRLRKICDFVRAQGLYSA